MANQKRTIVIGKTYGCWRVDAYWGRKGTIDYYSCTCSCGNQMDKDKGALLTKPKSCKKCFTEEHKALRKETNFDKVAQEECAIIEKLFTDPKMKDRLQVLSKSLIRGNGCWHLGMTRRGKGLISKTSKFTIGKIQLSMRRVVFRLEKGYLPVSKVRRKCSDQWCVSPDHLAFTDIQEVQKEKTVQIERQPMAKVDTPYMFLPTTTNTIVVDAYNKMRVLMRERRLQQAEAQKMVIFEYKLHSNQQEFNNFVGRMNVFLDNDAVDYPRIADYKNDEQLTHLTQDLHAELSNRQIGETEKEAAYFVTAHILDQIQLFGDKAPLFQSIYGKQGYTRNNWAMFNSQLMQNNMLLFEIFSGAAEHLFDKDTLLVTFPRAMSFVKHVIAEKNDIVNIALQKSYGTVKLELMFK